MRNSKCFKFQVLKMKINSSSLKTIIKMKTIRYSLNKITVSLYNSQLLSSKSKGKWTFNNIKWSMKIVHLLILRRNQPQPTFQLQISQKNPATATIDISKWKIHRRRRETRSRISSKRLLKGVVRRECNRLKWLIGRLRKRSPLTLKGDGSISRRIIIYRLRKGLISRGQRQVRE